MRPQAPCVCNRLRRSIPRPPSPADVIPVRALPAVLRDSGAARWRRTSQPVDQGPAFRLARKGLPHGRSRQSSEGPQRSAGPAKRVDGRGRPCVVNALRAKRGPIPSSRGSASTHPHLFQESPNYRSTGSLCPHSKAMSNCKISASQCFTPQRTRSPAPLAAKIVENHAGRALIKHVPRQPQALQIGIGPGQPQGTGVRPPRPAR